MRLVGVASRNQVVKAALLGGGSMRKVPPKMLALQLGHDDLLQTAHWFLGNQDAREAFAATKFACIRQHRK